MIENIIKYEKIVRADKRMMYWAATPYAEMFSPSVDHAAELLNKCYKEYNELVKKFIPLFEEKKQIFTWNNVTRQILEL